MVATKESQSIKIFLDSIVLEGILTIPKNAKGVVVFAHGSGSSKLSPRNTFVAQVLQKAGFATLLFDLLTEEEDKIYENRFNISLLTDRLKVVTNWLKKQAQTKDLSIGYFGASTGSASAIKAAADLKETIKAVVSRGGRPDLAEKTLEKIKSPTLLIVGGDDNTVLKLNRESLKLIKAEKKLEIIPGATHLFEEPGTLEKVAWLAANWFTRYLTNNSSAHFMRYSPKLKTKK